MGEHSHPVVHAGQAQPDVYPVGGISRDQENEKADARAHALRAESGADVSDVHLLAGAARASGAEIDQKRYQCRDQKCPNEAQPVEKSMTWDGLPGGKGLEARVSFRKATAQASARPLL